MNTLPGPAKLDLYGKIAFTVIVLVVFSEFLRVDRVTGTPERLVLVFGLGAIHTVVGILYKDGLGRLGRPVGLGLYFAVQSALVCAILLLTPLKGFSFLIAMPITSMAVLDLRWPLAAAVVAALFSASVGAIWLDFGAASALRTFPSYGIAFLFTVLFSVVTRRAHEARLHAEQLSAELGAANEKLRLLAAQADELATTRERNRLAREIHDGLGHYLTTINVQVEAARAVLAADPAQAAGAMEKAARLSRDALDDARRSVGALRADLPRLPLPQAIESLALNLGLQATVRLQGEPRALAPAIEHALYRSAQEGLTNVRKHASATHTELTLDYSQPARIGLTIADNGRGSTDAHPAGGYGLRGIRERLELLGGTMSAANRTGGGFALTVEIPA